MAGFDEYDGRWIERFERTCTLEKIDSLLSWK
jgi:hypothetical protein